MEQQTTNNEVMSGRGRWLYGTREDAELQALIEFLETLCRCCINSQSQSIQKLVSPGMLQAYLCATYSNWQCRSFRPLAMKFGVVALDAARAQLEKWAACGLESGVIEKCVKEFDYKPVNMGW